MAGPFFLPDLYSGRTKPPNFPALVAQANVVGAILKSTQGTTFAPSWFMTNWPAARKAAEDAGRYGTSFFRGLYHYGTPASSGAAQADYVVRALERAGGWTDRDMAPAWDLEDGQTGAWTKAGIQKTIDISSQFAERIEQLLGKRPILYSGATIRGTGITSKMGYQQLWTTHLKNVNRSPFSVEDVVLWQYAGGDARGTNYYDPAALPAQRKFPLYIPGWSVPGDSEDMNVVMDHGQFATSIGRVRELLIGLRPDETSEAFKVGVKLAVSALVGAGVFAGWRHFMRGRAPQDSSKLAP